MCVKRRVSIFSVLIFALAGAVLAASPDGFAAQDIREKAGECQGASNPNPADGSLIVPAIWYPGIYMLLDYVPCADAVSHTGYFSENEQDVIDRDPAHCLGNVPPWPAVSETAFVVGYDDPAIPEFARAPLVRGTTYYWCVDTYDGEQNIPGPTWSFTPIGYKAWGPSPADGELLVPNEGTMTWSLGALDPTGFALSYDVYIGRDRTAVTDATAASPEYVANVETESYDYGGLEGEYFWRVDTVLTLMRPPFTSTYTTGDVWSFTTPPYQYCHGRDYDLFAWWKLEKDGPPPGYVYDSADCGNYGTIHGEPLFVPGRVGNAVVLDGIDDWIEVENPVGIYSIGPRTIVGWVKAGSTTGISDWTNVFGFTGGDADGTHFDIEVVGDTNSTTAGYYGLNLYGEAYDIIPVDLEWHSIAAVWDQAELRLYSDGVLVNAVVPKVTPNTNDKIHIGKRQDNDNYFPGYIDNVCIYERTLSLKEIKILAGLLIASAPDPADGATGVSQTPTLSWTPGVLAAETNGSIVYYSEDEDAVANRTAPGIAVTDPCFVVPTTLDLGSTFYWAVDTVNGIETWPGDLWSFTVHNWLSVDDMETYTHWTIPGNNIFDAWLDGGGQCLEPGYNESGSLLSENADMPFVLGGLKSMKYDFDNNGSLCPYPEGRGKTALYSEIEAQTANLPSGIGSDWTVDGVKALQINFMGRLGNPTDPLWVKLQDSSKTYGTKVFYGDQEGEDPADINDPSWHQWDIDLADFNVDLENVVSIVIGLGDEDGITPGGTGTIYIDEIRLYAPRCIPNRRTPEFAQLDQAPEGDPDCKIDCKDLKSMAQNWLKPPKTPNLKDYAELAENWLKTETWPF